MELVVVDELVKVYSGRVVLDRVRFSVDAGRALALLGPNGAGKSTTLAILCGLLRPDAGRATIAGLDVAHAARAAHRALGVVFQEPVLYPSLTGRENLRLSAGLFGLRRDRRARRIAEVLELVQLSDRADERVAAYSGGMKRRLDLARALLHDPSVVLLDEPTLGIDVQTRAAIWDHVRRLRDEGRAIVLCTNYMDEAEELAYCMLVLDQGMTLAEGTPAELRASVPGARSMNDVFLALTGRQLRD